MIFKTVEKITDKQKGTIETSVQPFWDAKKTQAATNAYFDSKGLEKEQRALLQVARINKELAAGELSAAEAAQMRATAVADCSDEVKRLGDSDKTGIKQLKEYTREQKVQIEANKKAAASFKGFSSSFKAMALNIGAEMAIMLALTLAIKGFQKLNEEFHITAASKVEAMENAVNDYNEALEQSGDNISTIKGLQDEFETLARGVNDAGENVGLSADEYERYHEIVDELVAMNPELVQTYDKEGNAIIDRNTAIEKGIELQEEYQDKATRDYINSGDDVIKGANVNIRDALKDAQKDVSKMGEIGSDAGKTVWKSFRDTLFGETSSADLSQNTKDIQNAIKEPLLDALNGDALLGGNNSNINSIISDHLGREVDLATASVSTLRQIDTEFDQIIAEAKAQGYSDTAIEDLQEKYQSFHDSLVDIDTAYQPIKDWLTAVVNEADEAGNTIASSIPEEMSAGFTAGLEQIAYEGGTADQMKTKAEELAETLQAISRGETINGIDTEVSVKLEDGTKVVSTYQEALEDAEKAKKDFDDSNRNSDAVDDYNEAVETEVKVLNALADEWEDVDAAVAESLRSQANAINSYASDNIMTLTEALNPLADKFDEARGAKERFDAAMEASGDYDTAIDSFKEVYDEIMTSENTAGNGSIALNTGAAQILGQDRVFELGSIDKIKKELKEIKPILKGGEEGTRAFFERLRECEGALNKVSDGAVTVDKATGEISFDFDEDKWAEYARAMGVSVEVLSAAVDNARQFADIDLGNLETIKSSIMDMDGSIIKKNGKEVYQSLQNFRTAALAAGYGIEEINDRVEDLKDEGVHLIDLTEDAVTLAESLASLGSEYGLAQDSNKDGIYEVDAEKTITQMFAWGESVDSVRIKITELLEAAENGDIELNFEKPNDVSWEDWIEDLKVQFDTQFGESEDPFAKMASSADAFTAAVNDLIIALGHLPDNYEIGTNFDEIVDDINNLATNKNLSGDQKDNLTNNITVGIEDAKAEIEKYKQLLSSGDLTEAQEQELKLNIEDAEAKVEQFEAILQDLQDGKLDNFTFNIKTGEFIENSQVPEMTVKPVIEGSPEIEPIETPIVPKLEQPSLDKLEEDGVKIDADVQLNNENEIQQKLDEFNAPPIVRDIILGEQELPPNTVPFATQDIHLGEVETPETKFTGILDVTIRPILSGLSQKVKAFLGYAAKGTPQSPNYRAHSSFPSMAKGGRLGPRGNGGLTLTGELGTELVWIPSESRSFLVGQYGPEMVNLPGDAVVYPADQTRKILGDTISPGRLRFGTGSMAKGNMQFGSMGDANGSYNPNSHSPSSSSKNKNKNTKKSSIDAYEKELARLDHLLEMGYISEKTYYEKLQKLYTQHEKALKKNTEKNREALEKQRQARIDAYEYEKGLLDSKLDRGIIGEVKYYEKLLTLGKDYYTKDGKIRKGYADEWRKWREDLKNARNDAFDTEQEKLDSKLERDIINTEKYYKEAEKLRKKYNPEDRDEKYREAQDAVGEEWGKEIDKILQNVEDNELGIGGYNENTAIRKLKAQKTFIENMVKLYPELADEAKEAYREIAEAIKDLEDQQKEDLEEQKDQLETFIDLVEDMIRQEAEDYIDSLEDQKDAFDDLIDKRKEMLKLAEDEAAFYEDIEDGNREISKIQQEIDALSRDNSRAAQAKIAELEEEKAELVRNQNTTIRKETYDQAIDILDKQSELYGEIMDNAIKAVEDWLNNKAAVLDVVVDTIEQKETNDLLNRLVKFNGAHGDGYLSTVKDAVEDIDTLIGKYGTDIGKIVEILQKSVDDGTHVGLITPAEAGYEKPQMHHSGLAAGFTGNGATLKQNEVWRLLTDDELVLNKADQLRLGHSMGILESIKSSYANLSKSIEIPSTAVVPNVEIVIDSPITIQGNTSADIVNELDKFRHKLANDTFDKLNDALRLNGIFTGSSSNARKFN